MKNNNKFSYLKTLSLLVFSLVFTVSCSDNDDFGDDAAKVIPTIYSFEGPTTGFSGESATYSVKTRGGSTYTWSVNGAEMVPVPGRTDMITVNFNQYDELASVSVFETAANGEVSETSIIDNIKVFGPPCNWTIKMQDIYADGWNGAGLSIKYDGFDAGEYTLKTGGSQDLSIPVPNGSEIEISFSSGDWDEEITYQVYDASGTLVYEDGPTPVVGVAYTSTNTCP